MRLATLLFVLAGCSGMMIGPDAMRGSVADSVAEDNTHLAASRASTSLPSLLAEVDRHTARSKALMQDMRSHMASMQDCSQIDAMSDVRDGMLAEIDAHAQAMHADADLDTAKADIEAHVGTMTTMLDNMGMMLDSTHCGSW